MQTTFVNAQLVEDRVRLLYRDEEGLLKAKTLPAEWITYHPKELDADPDRCSALLRALRNDRRVLGVKEEGDHLRVRWRDKWARRDVVKGMAQSGIPVLEGDVNPVKRLVADLALGIQKPRRLYFDIETDSRVNFAQSRMGEARVLSWAAIDEFENEFTAVLTEWTDEAEAELLEAFWALTDRGEIQNIVEITRDQRKEVLKKRHTRLDDYEYDLDHGGHLSQTVHEANYGYDQLIAWSGRHGDETYDFLVMEKRSRRVGAMPKDISRFLWLDHHDVFERMNKNAAESGEEKQSLKLQDVAMSLVGHGKDDFDSSKTYEAWNESKDTRERLRSYNLKDVRLMLDIEKKSGYIEVFQALCEACGIFPTSYSLFPTVQMDGFMLRLGAERQVHFKTKHYDREEDQFPKEQFEGAFVLHPKLHGIIHDVHVGDFASMYPSIIITLNMSPDTKVGLSSEEDRPANCCRAPGTGVCFSTTKQGILAFAINEMLRLRAYWRRKQSELPPGTPEWVDAGRRSTAYKVAANSFFGAMGNRYSRYYDEEIAESITTTGAWLAKHIIAEAEKNWEMEALYGDTDALMVRGCDREKFRDFVQFCNEKLIPGILAEIGCVENRIKIENEKGYKRIAFMKRSGKEELAAKRYCAKYSYYKGTEAAADSEPEVKGLAWRRGDTNKMGRDLQWDVIQHFRGDDSYLNMDLYLKTIEKWRAHVLENELSIGEVKMTASLTKELDQYVVKKKKNGEDGAGTPHVRVAKIIKARGGEAMLGTRIEYFMKDEPTKTILPAEDYDGQCDRFFLWEKKVYKPSLTLLEAIFPEHDWKQYLKVRPKKVRGKAHDGRGRVCDSSGDSARRGAANVHPSVRGRSIELLRPDPSGTPPRESSGPALGKPKRFVRKTGVAHESFICGSCGDEIETGDNWVSAECAICSCPIACHEFPCAVSPETSCWACKEKKALPHRKKKVLAN